MSEDRFIFNGWKADREKRNFSFLYSIIRENEQFELTQTLIFPKPFSEEQIDHIHPTLDFLSLALGASYWKMFCPRIMETPHIKLSQKQAEFWNTVYTKGLGEFFYKNKIDFRGLVAFPVSKKAVEKAYIRSVSDMGKTPRALVLFGGGKDSLVTAEMLKQSKKQFSFFALGDFPILKEPAKTAEVELITVSRSMDPKFFELSGRTDVYNGHVPISLFYSGTALLTAQLYGFDEVVISAEHSANYGNVEYLGETINHQWSKSEEAETLLRSYIRSFITEDIEYDSLIRDMHEIQVAELFSHYPKYLDVFSSCNMNFSLTKIAKKKWCGECPKCAFVFAILSPFIPKQKLVSVFNKNLFADEALLPTYRELLGLEAFKPFECVGTPEETKLAFLFAHQKGEYENDAAMKQFVSLCKDEFTGIEKSKKKLLPNI